VNNVLHRVVLVAGLLLWAGRGSAWAQSAADKAAADTLFNEGKRLIAKGEDAAACAKFESSLAKVAQLGTQIALASCYEKVGKTASAWGAFRAAASAARKAHDKRQRFAEDHASALEARLSKIVITVAAGTRITGLKIERDAKEVMPAELGSEVPVDPGDHLVQASAPGRRSWSTDVVIPSRPGVVEVSVPALDKAPDHQDEPEHGARTEHAERAEPGGGGSTRRTAGYALGAGGIAIIGASLVVGAVARSSWNDAQKSCPDRLCEDPAGIDKARHARTLGNWATGMFIAGTAVTAVGVFLLFTAPSGRAENPQDRTALRLIPDVGPAQVGVTLQGGF
jgi:serine/threonine-protein kinase